MPKKATHKVAHFTRPRKSQTTPGKKKIAKKRPEPVPVPAFKSVVVFCPTLNHEVVVSNVDWNSWESECDMCGSHGENSFGFQCECGEYHKIVVRSW